MTKSRKEILFDNYLNLKREIPEQVQIIAVSKTFPLQDILNLHEEGVLDFGENKVQELETKACDPQVQGRDIKWHFIGHLQSNKVKKLLTIPGLSSLHSIDSFKLLKKINEGMADVRGEKLDIFLQVNTSEEDEKHGFKTIQELKEALEYLQNNSHPKLNLCGLMTMGKLRGDNFAEDAKVCFQKLAELKREAEALYALKLKLSMGMTNDYSLAIAAGSDVVRIGSKIFGTRS